MCMIIKHFFKYKSTKYFKPMVLFINQEMFNHDGFVYYKNLLKLYDFFFN